jgi:NitT/TauT family transport system permease protein
LPAILPALVTGLITGAGGAWNASVVAEYLTWRDHVYSVVGLGATISSAAEHADYPTLAAAVLTMAVLVVLINQLLWRRVRRFAEIRYSLA